jgi:hypothetical protein
MRSSKHINGFPRVSKRRWLLLFVLACGIAAADQPSVPTFGTTVVIPSGLQGLVYHIHHHANRLPDFTKSKAEGVIYTTSLNIPPQDFSLGFPGVTRRFEWFAIDYRGKFWIQKPGMYRFFLNSDDGSRLYIDDQLIIDNDGQHPPETREGSLDLSGGIHRIRVSYFQGPRFHVALVLQVAGPGEEYRVFSTDEFKPPPNPEDWNFPEAKQTTSR